MTRLLRVEYAGACYHVINRGNFGREIFGQKAAADEFVRTLGEAAQQFGWKIHAYVVMRNHFHLALELSESNLSVGMKWLQGTWTRRNNASKRTRGRPFQGRFKAIVVEPGQSFARVCHYIHLNPVRAKAVKTRTLTQYRWSSLSRFPESPRPAWLVSSRLLSETGRLKDTAKGWSSYVDFLRSLEKDPATKAEFSSVKFSRGWVIGSTKFRDSISRQLAEKGADLQLTKFAGLEPEEVQREKNLDWAERVNKLAGIAKIDLSRLPRKKSDPGKVLLASAMKHSAGVSNGWLAKRLDMGKPATVSQFVRRWMMNPERKRETERLLSKVKA